MPVARPVAALADADPAGSTHRDILYHYRPSSVERDSHHIRLHPTIAQTNIAPNPTRSPEVTRITSPVETDRKPWR
jgi:hypothetical protein